MKPEILSAVFEGGVEVLGHQGGGAQGCTGQGLQAGLRQRGVAQRLDPPVHPHVAGFPALELPVGGAGLKAGIDIPKEAVRPGRDGQPAASRLCLHARSL